MKPNFKTQGSIIPPENAEVQFIGLPTVDVEQGRYEELLKKEERLKLLERAIQETNSYDLSAIKSIFGLNKENENE